VVGVSIGDPTHYCRRQFQKARRMTRDALEEDGVAGEIDAAVGELLTPGTAPATA
jgi:hypothetical protein